MNILFRLSSAAVLCAFFSSCTTSELFPNTRKTLPELVVPYSVPAVEKDKILSVAKNKYIEKNYPEAMLYYEDATKLFPDDGEVLLAYAASADMSGKFQLADQAYRQYAKKFGVDFYYYNNAGYSMILRGNYKSARKYLLEAVKIEPSSTTVRNNITLLNKVERTL